MSTLQMVLSRINDIVWGPPMLILLFGTHLFLTFRLKFIQRFIGRGIKYSFQKDKDGKGDTWMVLLWRKIGGIPVWSKSTYALQVAVGGSSDDRSSS